MCRNVGPNCLTHQPIYLLVLKKKKTVRKDNKFETKTKTRKKKEEERKLNVREGPPN